MILIYTDELTPRIEYISGLIFTGILKKKVTFTQNYLDFLKSTLPKINYSYEKFDGEFYIKPHRLMHCRALIKPDIRPVWHNGEKYFFESTNDSDLPFDPLAASFYLVTRYEEYLDFKKDKHGRFPAEESILFKYGLLKKPVVNIWAGMIADKLKEYYPEMEFSPNSFYFQPTVDIDNSWAVLNKGILRSAGAMVKALSKRNLKEIAQRFNILFGREKDPYDTYNYLYESFKGIDENVIFFFLLGDYKKYDKNVSWKSKSFQKLIRETDAKFKTGIHPSYFSGKKKGKDMLKTEISRLEKITGSEVIRSRQHFLRLRFPGTYRQLIKAGITEDYSMGYPSHTGFRAGICTPYNFYDLKKEKETTLKIFPFQVMDVTLKNYLKMGPEEAWPEIKELMHEVKKAGGIFSAVWHNETITDMGEWKGYRDVFEKMIKLGKEFSDDRNR